MEPIVFTTGPDGATVLHTVVGVLQSLGFTVTPTTEWSGRAEVGSKTARVLAGGFSRRMVVDFQVVGGQQPSTTQAIVTAVGTGWSGGAIGASKAKTEMQSIHTRLGGALHQAGLLAG